MLSDLTTLVHQNVTKLLLSSVSMVALLFSAGEPGQLMPVDPAYLYQDTAGTTPVTATGQSVALWLDQSKGLVLGPELVTNGDFSAGSTGWTFTGALPNITISGGVASFAASTGNRWLVQSGILIVGKSYQITATVTVSAGTIGPDINGFGANVSSSGTYTWRITNVTLTQFQFLANNGFVGSIDNISVKELPGNHDTQPTVGSRPIYGKHPANGYRNMLASSEDFSAAVWGKSLVTITTNAATAPDGTDTADRFVSSGGAFPQIAQTATLTAGQSYTFSMWVLSDGTTQSAQALLLESGVTSFTPTSTWTRVSVTVASSAGGTRSAVLATNSGTAPARSFYIWGAQLEPGSTATTYQRTGASSGVAWPAPPSYNITEAGQPDLHYLHYNGVSSFMVSPTITPATDKVQVFFGVRKLSDAATAMVLEASADSASNAGSFQMRAPNGAAANYLMGVRGAVAQAIANFSTYAAPIINVLTLKGDLAGDVTGRVNGVESTIALNPNGTGGGNYLAYPIYTGRRAGTSLPFNGLVYSKIVRFGANLTNDQIASTERWTAQRTGVSL